jgi:hypothetical protein
MEFASREAAHLRPFQNCAWRYVAVRMKARKRLLEWLHTITDQFFP